MEEERNRQAREKAAASGKAAPSESRGAVEKSSASNGMEVDQPAGGDEDDEEAMLQRAIAMSLEQSHADRNSEPPK